MGNFNTHLRRDQIIDALNNALSSVQPDDLASVATSGRYADLLGKPIVDESPTDGSENLVSSGGVASAIKVISNAVAEQIDSGAKNLLLLTGENVTGYGVSCVFDPDAGTITLDGVNSDKKCTGSFNVQVADPVNMALTAGKAYHFMCDGTSNDTYGIYIYKSGATPVTQWDCFTNTDAEWNPVWSTSNGFRLFVRSGTVVDNVVLRPMICTAEDWAASGQFQPYCPSLPELYRMILALGGGNRSMQVEPEQEG